MGSLAGGGFGGKPTGQTLPAQAPIRGLQRAFAGQQAPAATPEGTADEGGSDQDRSALGGRLPQEPFSALMDVVRRFGRVY